MGQQQQHWNDMLSYLVECQSLRGRFGLFGYRGMGNYFPSKIFHKNGILNGKLAFADRDLA